ncbi:unnamed protein product [Eretmochelys imbricata]
MACPKVKETGSILLRLGRLLQTICTAIQPNRRPTDRPNQKETAKCCSVDRKCQKVFNKLKVTLMSDPVLRAPDFDKPFLVTTDASERGVGAVLMQKGPDQEFHPVVFLSKKLSERESNWSVTEKECYAIVYALEKLRPYVWGWRFHLQTDHAALKWLHTVKETNKKLLRWSLALQDFDFDIQHISGASNKVAHALSHESFPESTG